MELAQPKSFQKPDAGMFLGTIIDVVDMPNVPSSYNGVVTLKNKVRVIWVLGKTDGTAALDKDGKPLTVAGFYNAVLGENANLTKAIKQILNAAPPVLTNTEQIAQLLIGKSNQLFLVKADNKKNPADPYTNVAGIAPLIPGQVPPAIPAGFVRAKDQPAKTNQAPTGQMGGQGQVQQFTPTIQQAPAQPQQYVQQPQQAVATTQGQPATDGFVKF